MLIKTKNLLGKSTFPVYLLSLLFMITFSNDAINFWESPWNQLSIAIACLLPILLIIISNASWSVFRKDIPLEFYFIFLIILLGILNIFFGENFLSNFKGMGLFLLSGIFIFAATFFTLKPLKFQIIFLWLCTFSILGLSLNCIYNYKLKGNGVLFSGNPIPESLIITLLLAGPLLLLHYHKKGVGRLFFISCFILGVGAIIILEQRMAILSLLIIFYIAGFIFIKRFWVYSLCLIAIIGISASHIYKNYNELPNNLQKALNEVQSVPVYRMEMYFFALHLLEKKPLFGSGLWAPLTHHLADYKERIFTPPELDKASFAKFVNYGENTSFHSLPLCMLVQMGSLFTLVYIGVIFYLVNKSFNICKEDPDSQLHLKLLFIIMSGFMIQSLAIDSLMYPSINFLFHSFLGLTANIKFHKHPPL